MAADLSEVQGRFERNLQRTENLVELYRQAAGSGQGRRPVYSTDILRAATVFLHATLEDFLRGVAELRLPEAPPEALQDIPLIGTSDIGRPTKFSLADLARHRKKSVRRVITDSVVNTLEVTSFNNLNDVTKLLGRLGVQPSKVNGRFFDLGAFMKRRHHIVHRADANPQRGKGHHSVLGLNQANLDRWVEAVREFVDAVSTELDNQ